MTTAGAPTRTPAEAHAGAAAPRRGGSPGWWVVAEQESRDLWLSGRGPLLVFAYSILLSAVTYLEAINQTLNFLEQREAVDLTLQIAVAIGALVTLIVAADAVSGERERGTLESMLLTPVRRRDILLGKLIAALTVWGVAFVVAVPYVWVLGRGVSIVASAVALGLVIGTLIALGLGAIGLLISAVSNSNKVSLSASLFLLFALFAPTQLPSGLPQGWFFDVLVRVNPVGSGLHYISAVLVRGHSWTQDLSYLVSPIVTVIVAGTLLFVAGPRIVRLHGGVSTE